MITIKNYLSIEEINEKIKESNNIWIIKKLQVLSDAIRNKRTAKELSENSDLALNTVQHLISNYNRFGPTVLENKHLNVRNNSYMTTEEEENFLKPFFERAKNGYISTQKEIKIEYEKAIGKTVHRSTISRLLKRWNWRKIVPRPKHPKGSKEEQEEFKKKDLKKK